MTSNLNFGLAFSRDFEGNDPLGHIGKKLPVYMELLERMEGSGVKPFVITRKTYKGDGFFEGVWSYSDGLFTPEKETKKMDIVYDRTGGVSFPPEGDTSAVWVNDRAFKLLAWNKWEGYKKIPDYMPKTYLIESERDIETHLPLIEGDRVVLKPINGLQGIGVFVGPKDEALNVKFPPKYPIYIMQEFVDSSKGIKGIAEGTHDLRVVVVNGNIIWTHVREPKKDSLKANVAEGGSIREVEVSRIPEEIKKAVEEVSEKFSEEYDNPTFSADFGMDKTGRPFMYEINDQYGFPTKDMVQKDRFLDELIANFTSKLS